MSPPVDVAAIGDLIRTIAREEMLPRFRQLAEHEISHKAPGDLVTIVDHAVEDRLSEALAARIPGSVTVGEEAVAAHAATLDRLDAEAWAWVIDPLDGTRNFAEGRVDFASIVALVRAGVTVAGWIYLPVTDRFAVAEAGSGAFLDGDRMRVEQGMPLAQQTGAFSRPRGTTARALAAGRLADALGHQRSITCAGADYVRLCGGGLSLMMPRSLHPWDHAAGVLMHGEAGGFHGLVADGRPYGPRERTGPLLLTPDRRSWEQAVAIMGSAILA